LKLSSSSSADLLTERFRCAADLPDFIVREPLSQKSGYFRLGAHAICYGQCSSRTPETRAIDGLYDASDDIAINGSSISLPFDAAQVVDNLRYERYQGREPSGVNVLRSLYYLMRPLLGAPVRRRLQQFYFRHFRDIAFPSWPVDRTVEEIFERLLILSMKAKAIDTLPFIWYWPDGALSCTTMTHDVETGAGLRFCRELMDLDDSFGIKSSFQIVPEARYRVSAAILKTIRNRGFEINIHDLNHDGLLWAQREEFLRRAERINSYGRQYGAIGFRSAVMYRNLDWYNALDFSYDMSLSNVAHLDPQRGGCCTVLPFFIGEILELPLTTTQDYSLFEILRDYSVRLWQEQVSLIREKHGLISFIIHPDYVEDVRARKVYFELLGYLSEMRSKQQTWIALPGEIAEWWRLRSGLTLVHENGAWRIRGDGNERARIALAVLQDDRLTYEIGPC